MSEHPVSPHRGANPRDEKLQAIAAVFGEAVAARLARAPTRQEPDGGVDADRVAWQTNRLIQHLRLRTETPQPRPAASAPRMAAQRPKHRAAAKLPSLMAGEDLAAEHPAVIAHMLRDAPQELRVAVLRALPGRLARSVMRRLRDH